MPRAPLTLPALLLALLAAPAFAEGDGHDHDHDHAAREEHGEHDHDHGDEDHPDHDHDHGDEDHADHDHAHVHGHAMLSISIDGQLVEAALTLPGGDLFPEGTADADKTVETATQFLDSAGLGLTLPDAAGCETITFDVSVSMVEDDGHEEHTDYSARRVSLCADPDALDRIGLSAFDAMPALETIDLALQAPGFSLEAELEPGVTGILLAPPLSY